MMAPSEKRRDPRSGVKLSHYRGIVLLDDVCMSFPGKAQWVAERWDMLRPIKIGPWAFWRRDAAHDYVSPPTSAGVVA
jgi:hypothetical protein